MISPVGPATLPNSRARLYDMVDELVSDTTASFVKRVTPRMDRAIALDPTSRLDFCIAFLDRRPESFASAQDISIINTA